MTVKDLILAIDVGTQSTKALVYTLEGRVLSRQQVPYRPYFSQQPGWAEQDPDVYWQAVCQACRELWHSGEADQNRVAGLALTAQRPNMSLPLAGIRRQTASARRQKSAASVVFLFY